MGKILQFPKRYPLNEMLMYMRLALGMPRTKFVRKFMPYTPVSTLANMEKGTGKKRPWGVICPATVVRLVEEPRPWFPEALPGNLSLRRLHEELHYEACRELRWVSLTETIQGREFLCHERTPGSL